MKLYITRKPEQKGIFTAVAIVAKGSDEFRRAFERLNELVGPNGTIGDLLKLAK